MSQRREAASRRDTDPSRPRGGTARLLAVKLRRDLRATWARLTMMVLAIAVSLIAFSAVLYAWSTIDRETERAYLGTEPASATIQFGPGVAPERMAEIAAAARQRPGVIEATGRTQFGGEVAVAGRTRKNQLQVYVAAPDDPMRMANFEVRHASWPPGPGEVFVREDSLALLDIELGDRITVRAPSGRLTLRVTGTVYDPSLAPAPQQQAGQAYLSTTSLPEPALDQLKLQVADPGGSTPSRDRDTVVAGATEVAEWLRDRYGVSIREVQVPEPYAHPHQGQAEALLAALLGGAAAALLLSAILVATMLNGLFTQQIPQIGIMKAIGARSGRIGRHYLAMTLVVAGAATLLAFAPGLLIGRRLAPNVLGFLGIEPTTVAPTWWTYLVVLGAGLVLPLAMALPPLLRASRITVRAAIDHHGGTDRPGTPGGLVARLSRVRGMDRGLLMALRNTVRRPARFALAVGLLALAGMTFVAGMSTREGTSAVAEESEATTKWDVTVQLDRPASPRRLVEVAERVPGVARAEAWTRVSAGVAGPGELPVSRTYPDQGHGGVFVTAVPEKSRMLVVPELREGRWLRPGETGAIVLSQVTLRTAGFDVSAGDSVDLYLDGEVTRWRVVGIAEERGDAGGAYVTAAGLADALGSSPRSGSLRIATDRHDAGTREAVAAAVQRRLTAAGIGVRSAESVDIRHAATEGHLGPVLAILLATALPMAVIGLIGLASTMGANVLDRTREFGVMHAIGARPKAVRRIVVAEGVFTALASCLLAALPAVGLTLAMNALLGGLFFNAPLPLRISWPAAGIWILLVALGAKLATDAAATRASRLTVREALSYL